MWDWKAVLLTCVIIFCEAFVIITHYEDKYERLRSEIRLATDVDISYPYGDDRLNKSWLGGKE